MQSQGHRALFYEETEGGHGGGGDLRREANFYASEYLFLQRELGGAEPKPLAAAPQARDAALDEAAAPSLDCRELDAMESATAIDVTPSQRTRHVALSHACAESTTSRFTTR
jgi:hypothetical protein